MLRVLIGMLRRGFGIAAQCPQIVFAVIGLERCPRNDDGPAPSASILFLLVVLGETFLEVLRAEWVQRRVVAGSAGRREMRAAPQTFAATGGPQFGAGRRAVVAVTIA